LYRKTIEKKFFPIKNVGRIGPAIQQEIFAILRQLENDEINSKQMMKSKLLFPEAQYRISRSITPTIAETSKTIIFSSVNKPLRVCAVVRTR